MMRDCPMVYKDTDLSSIINKPTEQKLIIYRFSFQNESDPDTRWCPRLDCDD
ncbi:MAG: hypothetical protein ACK521_11810 [bacterium]